MAIIDINIPIEDAVTNGSLNPVTSNAVFDALANKVPYTGATADVDLGEFELKSGQIEFDQTPTGTAGVAVMRWNDTDGTVDLGLKGGNVTLQVGQEQVLRVVNKTATNVNLLEANYQAVRVTGAQGQRLNVDLAQATTDLLSAETIGLVTETINNNQEGFITTSGLIRNINTTGSIQSETWVDGDILYLSPTVAGRVTNVKPSAPNHLIIVGYVVSAHITQGSIFVKVDNGYELDELHNVDITSVANGQVLQYDSATSLWKNATPSGGGITVGTTAVTSGTVGRIFFQGTGNVVQQDAGLSWDNTNKKLTIANSFALNGNTGTGFTSMFSIFRGATEVFRVDEYKSQFTGSVYMNSIVGAGVNAIIFGNQSGGGNLITMSPTQGKLAIGYASPTYNAALDVKAQGALSTDVAFRVRNSADTLNFFQVNGDGTYFLSSGGGATDNAFSRLSDGRMFMAKSGSNFIELNATTGQNRLFFSSNGAEINVGTKELTIQGTTCAVRFGQNNLQINTGAQAGSGTNAIMIQNGTPPSTSPTDHFWIYSADIVAGNAAPHFRTENGNIIKLYQQSSAGILTVPQLVTVLQNLGLLS